MYGSSILKSIATHMAGLPTPTELDSAIRYYRYLQNINPKYIAALSRYFLQYHSIEYILANSANGMLKQDGINYHIVYHGSLTRGKLISAVKSAKSQIQVSCSYRYPDRTKYPNIQPVVMLSLITDIGSANAQHDNANT
jgi:hypothetical protein